MANPILRKNGWVIQPGSPLPGGGDVHDTFRVDRNGNISGGHTTIRTPGNKEVQLPWNQPGQRK